MKFSQLPPEEQDWIDSYLDGTIGTEDFDALRERMLIDPELRKITRAYLSLDHHLLSEAVETSEPGEAQAARIGGGCRRRGEGGADSFRVRGR